MMFVFTISTISCFLLVFSRVPSVSDASDIHAYVETGISSYGLLKQLVIETFLFG